MQVDDKGMASVYSSDSGNEGFSIRIKVPRPIDELDQKWIYEAVRVIERGMRLVTAKLDPKSEERRAEIRTEFQQMFAEAGFPTIYMEEIPNEYWPDSYADAIWRSPWFMITTPIGHFKVGWRKRVIRFDWTKTVLKNFDLKSRGEVTHDYGSCDAYGVADGIKVLKELKAALDSGEVGKFLNPPQPD